MYIHRSESLEAWWTPCLVRHADRTEVAVRPPPIPLNDQSRGDREGSSCPPACAGCPPSKFVIPRCGISRCQGGLGYWLSCRLGPDSLIFLYPSSRVERMRSLACRHLRSLSLDALHGQAGVPWYSFGSLASEHQGSTRGAHESRGERIPRRIGGTLLSQLAGTAAQTP